MAELAAVEGETFDDSIILGAMFFQQFSMYASYNAANQSSYIELYVNENALNSTYLGNETYQAGPSAFVVPKETLPVATVAADSPLFLATTNSVEGNYYLNFNQKETVVWSTDCSYVY